MGELDPATPETGYFSLLFKLLFHPVKTFSQMLPDGRRKGRAFVFSLIFFYLFNGVFSVLYACALPPPWGHQGPIFKVANEIHDPVTLGFVIGAIVVMPLILLAALGVFSFVLHGVLRVLGAGASGLAATFKVICYAEGIGAFWYFVPIVGNIIWLGCLIGWTIIGAAKLHRTAYGRATAAVFLSAAIIAGFLFGFGYLFG